MSRIGRLPITVPAGVTVTVDSDNLVTVKGPKGTLSQQVNPAITVNQEGNIITLTRPSDAAPHRAMHGLYRTLVNNMVVGVSAGFQKTLELVGTGYRSWVNYWMPFNGGIGLLFGLLYRKYGLRYAMIAHGGCHVVSKLIWILFVYREKKVGNLLLGKQCRLLVICIITM